MTTAKDEILNRIKTARGHTIPPIERGYLREGLLSAADRIDLFIDRLNDYGAAVYRASLQYVPQTVAGILRSRSKTGLLVPGGLDPAWLPDGFDFIRADTLTYAEIDSSEGVLTGCAVAIAMTGTIVVRHSPGEGRRALTLIPDYHLCIVFEHQVVETVAEAIQRMTEFATYPITTVSGPSATSDIEMTRIKGVHGPRTLEILLVAD
ncbi:MAG: LUD domain-containing protein [Bryobacteraceae bacterium]